MTDVQELAIESWELLAKLWPINGSNLKKAIKLDREHQDLPQPKCP